MGFTLFAFYKSVTSQGTLQALPPVSDPLATISGNDLYVPDKYNNVLRAAAFSRGSTDFGESRLQAPSLREMWYPGVTMQRVSAPVDSLADAMQLEENPLALEVNEGLNFYSDGGGNGTTAADIYGLVALATDKVAPSNGKIFTMRATAAITLSAGAWVNGALTLDQTLPVGNYDVVGLRVEGTGLVAGRLVFVGPSAVARPGVFAVADSNGRGYLGDRYGAPGVLGTFYSQTPPTLDGIGDTGTSQVVYLDLIKR